MHAIVHAADIQDRDGGAFIMATMFGMYPLLMKLYADGGYQGPLFRRAVAKIMARLNVEIVKRSDSYDENRLSPLEFNSSHCCDRGQHGQIELAVTTTVLLGGHACVFPKNIDGHFDD